MSNMHDMKAKPQAGADSVNTDYAKVPIFPDFGNNFPDFSPIFLPYSRFYVN